MAKYEKTLKVLLTAVKRYYLATDELAEDVCQVADLGELYKVFERC